MPAPRAAAAAPAAEPLTIAVDGVGTVSALRLAPPSARAGFVFAHGAGAGMTHPFIAAVAAGLAERGIATLRFQFPFIDAAADGARRGRPDPPAVAQATVRAAVAYARSRDPAWPWFAGGKSFGGRMTSQAAAAPPGLPGVDGLVFVGFPLHPAGRPATTRAGHLADVALPMLFVQGTRDALAEAALIDGVVAALGDRALLHWINDADHAFHVRRASGRDDIAARSEVVDAIAGWIDARLR